MKSTCAYGKLDIGPAQQPDYRWEGSAVYGTTQVLYPHALRFRADSRSALRPGLKAIVPAAVSILTSSH